MNWIKNLSLLSISILFSYGILIIGDWYVEGLLENLSKEINKEARQIQDKRISEEDLPQREEAINDGFYPVIYPKLMDNLNYEYPLIAGMPNTDTYYCNEGYGLIRYRSDRFGFRNKNSDWDSLEHNIVIGDSFVHGACVDDEQTLPHFISKMSNITTLNLGMGSNSPSQYLTYSSLFIPKIKPLEVFLVFYQNDFGIKEISAIEEIYINQGKKIFKDDSLYLIDEQIFKNNGYILINELRKENKTFFSSEQNLFYRILRAFKRHVKLPNTRELIFKNIDNKLGNLKSQFESTKKSIIVTDNLCKKFGCLVTIVYIPNSEFYMPDNQSNSYPLLIKELSDKLNLQFIDGREVIDRSKVSNDYAIKGPHLSPIGYEKIAKLIMKNK